jgi:hypothetical protein
MDIFFTLITTSLVVFFGFLIARLLKNHLHEAKLLRFREMAHSERMRAMEKDIPVPAIEPDLIEDLLRGGSGQDVSSAENRAAKERLVRLIALCLGLTTLLGGLGLTLGLHFQADTEASGMWGIGLIPTLIGVGLLIFVRLSKSIETSGA